jgi:hypothetical protein
LISKIKLLNAKSFDEFKTRNIVLKNKLNDIKNAQILKKIILE